MYICDVKLKTHLQDFSLKRENLQHPATEEPPRELRSHAQPLSHLKNCYSPMVQRGRLLLELTVELGIIHMVTDFADMQNLSYRVLEAPAKVLEKACKTKQCITGWALHEKYRKRLYVKL